MTDSLNNIADLAARIPHSVLSTQHSVLALGFITPAFAIAGVLLVAIPIIIHLLNRRRYKVLNWAAMQFLLAAMRKNRRRLQFEQWLLLATRCCLLALLGLALARPLGCEDSTLGKLVGSSSALHVVVLDNSYSMGYQADRPDAVTDFDQAKRMAKQMVEGLASGGESVVLITSSKPAQAVLAKPSYDLAAVSSAIDRIELSAGGTDLLGAFRLADKVADEETTQTNRLLHIFSDGTNSAWRNGNEKALEEIGRKLATRFKIEHFNLAQPQQANAAILDVKPATNLVRTRFANDFLAIAKAYGFNIDASVIWKLGDTVLPGGAVVKLDQQTPPITQSNAQITTGGPNVLTVSLGTDDRLKVDNTRYRTIDVASDMKVLIVEGKHGTGPVDSSGTFLELALAPPSSSAGPGRTTQSYLHPERISDIELSGRVMSEYRVIMFADVARLTEPLADQLKKYVEQGGTIVWFMGDQVARESYNSILVPRGLLPGTLTQRMTGSPSFSFNFNPTGNVHPMLRAFANIDKSGIDTAQVFTYWQVSPKTDLNVDRVLDFSVSKATTGASAPADPAITEHRLGDGKVVFIATTANAEWNTLPAKPAYLALVHEIVGNTVSGAERWMNIEVGQPIEVPATVQMTSAPTLADSTGNAQPMEQVRREDGSLVYRSRPIAKPGIYKVGTGNTTIPVSVNVPADEADIRPLANDAIRSAMGNIDMQTLGDVLPAKGSGPDQRNDYGWSIMTIVLLLLAAECFMAMRFGHYKK